jgi:hypothetical protein
MPQEWTQLLDPAIRLKFFSEIYKNLPISFLKVKFFFLWGNFFLFYKKIFSKGKVRLCDGFA